MLFRIKVRYIALAIWLRSVVGLFKQPEDTYKAHWPGIFR